MGLLTGLIAKAGPTTVEAALEGYKFPAGPIGFSPLNAEFANVTRAEAMQVPAVARARNLLCGTIAELPIHRFDRDGNRLNPLRWQTQPDESTARAVTLAYTVDDLFFRGWSWWQIDATYLDGGRPSRFHRLDPARVSYDTDDHGRVLYWTVDLNRVPDAGPGSLIAIQGTEEGLLRRAGRTIRTALDLERAAGNYARTPLPAAVLKNSGVDLPPNKVAELLAQWRAARSDGAVGYLNSAIELEAIGWDPASLQLTEARHYVAEELARACNVPGYYLGVESNSMTYSNTTNERRNLVDYSLRPLLSSIEQRLSMDDVSPFTQTVRFGLDEFLRGDPTERMATYQTLLGLGVVDVDEVRAMEDLAPRGGTT